MRFLQIAVGGVFIVSLLGALSWLSFLDVLAVEVIAVEGNEEIRTRAVESQMMLATAGASWGLFSRQNIIVYPSSELENILAFEFPKIEKVLIMRKPLQQRIEVSITEREPYAQWCRTDECYSIDRSGYVYEALSATSNDFVTFSGGVDESRTKVLRTSVAPEYFEQIRTFIAELSDMGLQVVQVTLEGEDARILFADGWELRVALDKDLAATSFNLAAVLDEYELKDRLIRVRYIDMRFDERIYYKMREGTDKE
jgi:cell division septal protein FtsQ